MKQIRPPIRRRLHLPRIPRRKRYPIWSVGTITQLAVVVIALTAGLVFWFGKRSLFYETELTLAIVAASLFTFLTAGLYFGVRVRRKDVPIADVKNIDVPTPDASNFGDWGSGLDLGGGDEGCLGAIVGLVLGVIAIIVLLFVLWFALYLGVVIWVLLLAALAWVFYLALRQVFAKSRVCQGNLVNSLKFALLYTLLYTGWLFALVWIAGWVFGSRLANG